MLGVDLVKGGVESGWVRRKGDGVVRLDWIGLDWIGLDWIGLAWLGLAWLGLAESVGQHVLRAGTAGAPSKIHSTRPLTPPALGTQPLRFGRAKDLRNLPL